MWPTRGGPFVIEEVHRNGMSPITATIPHIEWSGPLA